MEKRILVKAKSKSIPGRPPDRKSTMANLIAEKEWSRKYEEKQDKIIS